jgi:hypothetical protein
LKSNWNGRQYEEGQSRVPLGFLAFSQVCAHDEAALESHHALSVVDWVQRAQALQAGSFGNVVVEVVVGPFGGVTQEAGDVAALGHVEVEAVLAVAVANGIAVLDAQESPTEETRQEAWMGLKSFH